MKPVIIGQATARTGDPNRAIIGTRTGARLSELLGDDLESHFTLIILMKLVYK